MCGTWNEISKFPAFTIFNYFHRNYNRKKFHFDPWTLRSKGVWSAGTQHPPSTMLPRQLPEAPPLHHSLRRPKREDRFCHKMFLNLIDFKVPVGSKYIELYVVGISKYFSIRRYKFHTEKLIFRASHYVRNSMRRGANFLPIISLLTDGHTFGRFGSPWYETSLRPARFNYGS